MRVHRHPFVASVLLAVLAIAAPAAAQKLPPSGEVDPSNLIVTRGTVDSLLACEEVYSFGVATGKSIVYLPCLYSAPEAGCEQLNPGDEVLIGSHFGDVELIDCGDCVAPRNKIVLDWIVRCVGKTCTILVP